MGERFGRLVVQSFSHTSEGKGKNAYWLCVCDCGNETVVSSGPLRTGCTQSCGCLASEQSRASIKKAHTKGDDLYFIKSGDYVKIGRSSNCERRFSDLQASNPYPSELLLVLKGQGHREREYHEKLKEHHHRGEWFKIDGCEVVDIT